jgi:tetratricopeptide (TPR) repeat protein
MGDSKETQLDAKKFDEDSLEYGIYLFFTNQLDKATQLLAKSSSRDSSKALLYAMISFLNGLSSFSESVLEEAITRIWTAEAIAKADKTSMQSKVVRAEAYFLGSIIQLVQESYLKAAWNIRTSWNLYDSARKELESDYDGPDREQLLASIDFGIGMFNLIISLLPPGVLSVVEWIGFSGKRDLALELLTRSFESKTVRSPFSALFLLVYYVNLSDQVGDYDERYMTAAKGLLDWADKEFPNSIMFSSLACRYHRCQGELDAAIEVAEKATKISEDLPGIQLLFLYNAGWCGFLKLDHQSLIDYFLKIFEGSNASSNTRTNFAATYAYMIGLCYAMLGDKQNAEKHFQQVPDFQKAKLRPFDNYTRRKAGKLLDGRTQYFLDCCESVAHFGAFAQMNSELLQLYAKKLEEIDFDALSFDDKARTVMFQGYIHLNEGDNEKTVECCDKVIGMEDVLSEDGQKDGIMPHTYYVKARALCAMKQFDDALSAHASGEKYTATDVSRFLGFRLFALKQTIIAKQQQAA